MIDAKQARENSYDKTTSWCESHLQSEIEQAIIQKRNRISRLFWNHEVNPEKLQQTLINLGFKVEIENMTELAGLSDKYGMVYNVIISW